MKIGIVILNYQNWQDSLVCAESVLASAEAPDWVVIVDNASPNDSVRWIRHWAAGKMDFVLPELGAPAICAKPFPLVEELPLTKSKVPHGSIILLHNEKNKGYAAGNNAGICLLLEAGADAVWILNNDTVVDPNALGAMRKRLFSKSSPGLCGSRIQYMGIEKVQCCGGGKTNPWTGLSRLEGHNLSVVKALAMSPKKVEQRINFIYGASVMVSRTFVEQVGLMDERYFLYCEEQDWAYNSKGQFDFAYASDALVYHKEGATTGFSGNNLNLFSLWHLTRSRVLLTAKHKPWALPTVGISILFAAFRMCWRRCASRLI
ncbi:glycosyltransferase family 2 protein [uncultured Pseudodesulfovibrio sp.]|uniref:glycosyltransferase family 2 protein n=1 Tax=uncultured Pseudodesulfovibrio sp. TaxID=2035858 RepID=UPI0029C6D401|nr:glycosyltransferase family 2 protein [uncultured Pseudodesulfovibrio sp.]